MAEIDAELRTAITAFLRLWLLPEWFAENGEEEFEQVLNVTANGNIGSMFRTFYAEHVRVGFVGFVDLPPHAK